MTESHWLTTSGETGTLTVRRTADRDLQILDWETEARLSLTNVDGTADELVPNQYYELTIRVGNYTYGMDTDPDRVYATLEDGPERLETPNAPTKHPRKEPTKQPTNAPRKQSKTDTAAGKPRRTLKDLSGDGDRIDLVVWVADVSGSASDAVLQIGHLADYSVDHTPPFITFDNAGTKKLQPRKRYLLRNVKDNYYEKHDRVQVVIDGRSEILERKSGNMPDSMTDRDFKNDHYGSVSDIAAVQLEEGLGPMETPEDSLDRNY